MTRASGRGALALAIGIAWSAGCDTSTTAPAPDPAASAKPAAGVRVEIVAAGSEPADVAQLVGAELERAKKDGKELVVYVGAVWCEPCKHFHDAAVAGKLDQDFPSLRLLEFDLDRDQDRLEAAGYGSKMIPLFAIPGPDGRGTGKQIEGSIKGAGSVRQITPRLRELMSR